MVHCQEIDWAIGSKDWWQKQAFQPTYCLTRFVLWARPQPGTQECQWTTLWPARTGQRHQPSKIYIIWEEIRIILIPIYIYKWTSHERAILKDTWPARRAKRDWATSSRRRATEWDVPTYPPTKTSTKQKTSENIKIKIKKQYKTPKKNITQRG